jgi:hypothetical protein
MVREVAIVAIGWLWMNFQKKFFNKNSVNCRYIFIEVLNGVPK